MSRDRFIILISILIVIAIGILLWMQARDQNPPVKVTVENETDQMKAAVLGLYNTYQRCMSNPPPKASGQVSRYCQAHNKYASASFTKNLEKGGVAKAGADPIYCAQNSPIRITMGTVNPAQQTVEVIENFGSSTNTKIKAALVEEENIWKVDNFTCPLP